MQHVALCKQLVKQRFYTRAAILAGSTCSHHIGKHRSLSLSLAGRIILIPHCAESMTVHLYEFAGLYRRQRGARALNEQPILVLVGGISASRKNKLGLLPYRLLISASAVSSFSNISIPYAFAQRKLPFFKVPRHSVQPFAAAVDIAKSDILCVTENVLLRLKTPKLVMTRAYLGKVGIERIVLSELGKVGDCNERHILIGVDELLSALDLGQTKNGIDDRIHTADVRYHRSGIDIAGLHHAQSLAHIIRISSARTDDVCRAVMNIVEVKLCGKRGIGGSCKEIKTAVSREQLVAHLYDRLYRRIDEHIVIALAAGQLHHMSYRIVELTGVKIYELDALCGSLFDREYLLCTCKARIVKVCYYNERGLAIAGDSIVDSSESHRTRARKDSKTAALYDAHIVNVLTGRRVVACMERTDDAGDRLRKRAVEECVSPYTRADSLSP